MPELLFDIKPETGRTRITIRLACAVNKKGCCVRYTDSSDSVFTSELLRKGIGRVLYPDDLLWMTPDLTLLDLLLTERAKVYEQCRAAYLFITTRPEEQRTTVNGTRVIYLPPSPYTPLSQGAREADFVEKLGEIKESRKLPFVIGLLEGEETRAQEVMQIYKAIRRCSLDNPRYSFIVLTNQGEAEEQLFALPDNITVYRPQDLHALLPLCSLALTGSDLHIQAECTFARIPTVEFSPRDLRTMTARKLDKHIGNALDNRAYLCRKQEELCDFYEQENQRIDELADELINYIERKRARR